MSQTALAWLLLYLTLAFLTLFRRPSFGASLYMMTFYAPPGTSWWGRGALEQIGNRWALMAGLVFLVAVIMDRRPRNTPKAAGVVLVLLGLYSLNAICVHFIFGDTRQISMIQLDKLLKSYALLALLIFSMREPKDYWIFIYTIIVGGLYIGADVYFRDAGRIFHGRLEGVNLGGADDANYLSLIMSISLVLAGCLILAGTWKERMLAVPTAVLLVEIIQKSGSRGMMIAMAAGGIVLVLAAPGKARLKALAGVMLAGIAFFMIVGQSERVRLLARFETIFIDDNERDASAEGRLDSWPRALQMIQDHPLGSGGEAAFKSYRGQRYLMGHRHEGDFQAVHNGYLDIAASWGIQGFILYMAAIIYAAINIVSLLRRVRQFDTNYAFLSACLISSLVILLVGSMFISSLRGEWFYWWMALSVMFTVGMPEHEDEDEDEDEDDDDSIEDWDSTLESSDPREIQLV